MSDRRGTMRILLFLWSVSVTLSSSFSYSHAFVPSYSNHRHKAKKKSDSDTNNALATTSSSTSSAPSTVTFRSTITTVAAETHPGCSTSTTLRATKSNWGIADDWSELSSENPRNGPDSSSLFNTDPALEAARAMMMTDQHHQEEIYFPSEEEEYVTEAVETINSMRYNYDPNTPPLYDTLSSFEAYAQSPHFMDEVGREIGLLVRCNERPEDMLVREGRALPKLSSEEKYHVDQLVTLVRVGGSASGGSLIEEEEGGGNGITGRDKNRSGGLFQYKATDFLTNAVSHMFRSHATSSSSINYKGRGASIHDSKVRSSDDELELQEEQQQRLVLNFQGVASWMTKSLGGNDIVGRHDKRVTAVISRYGTYGSGELTEEQFQRLYLDAVVGNMENDSYHSRHNVSDGNGIAMMKKLKLKQPTVESVWRDLENHGINPPVIEIRKKLQAEIDAKVGDISGRGEPFDAVSESALLGSLLKSDNGLDMFMDECEILEWGAEEEEDYVDRGGRSSDDNELKFMKKSSHELIELASDNKTPKRMRDGEFVFIDEESCIGCKQCVNIAPSAFTMMETGRARTFRQSNTPEVPIAVSACPVSCMHNVAFHELKEFESARDKGDGRTDHRHMGQRKVHTPLNVARTGSDANHKSSWYHYLKGKCFTSKSCPQRGCYDCPMFDNPGDNPHFKSLHRAAEKTRVGDFIASGEADIWRKTAEL